MGVMKELASKIQDSLRLRTYLLGIKYFEKEEDLDKIEKVRRPEEPLSLCQILGIARHLGWTMGATVDNLSMAGCIYKLGFYPSEIYVDGTGYAAWTKTKEDAVKCASAIPHLPFGRYKAVVVGPLAAERFAPDFAWIFSNTAQMNLMLNALQWSDYERMTFHFSGEGSCADAFAECYNTGKPKMTVPCAGERLQGLVLEDELEIVLPINMLKNLADGIDGLKASRIFNYPVPYYGFQMHTGWLMSKAYGGYDTYKNYMSNLRQKAKDYKPE